MPKLILAVIARLLASPYIRGALLLFMIAGSYLGIRKWADRRTEREQDTEIVREGEEYLGTWGNRSDAAFIIFRLHRNGAFTFRIKEASQKDTVITTGQYEWLPLRDARSINDYPRIIARDASGDTIFNYFVAYITPYDSKTDKTDRMELSVNGKADTTGYTFFRLNQ
ncbi:hypothetical protein [Niabella aurantiaca]|uniref:hypothetical protein n=1 Tax=Niabella aurantiaca TaxID=379900 RepID=UPI000364571F|nr:hypothetical protein [Niabella aurantiaca]